ncbi:hypothetical protein HHI36_020080 [Cryptolaemus montrouzieri]|uniref:t-SNARE coiled-coil homology domain-containing protein n=1 Tax=Cryptolaemus montrouzieri TaxID=559131 RepID=A0ABD2N9F3_9CUCU
MKDMDNIVVKQPLRVLEIPLSKFTEEVIPHCQRRYDKQKVIIHKLLAEENSKELRKEITSNTSAIKQLKDLMYELDSLKLQVQEQDVTKFDIRTLPLRKSIVTMITGYTDLSKLSQNILNNVEEPIYDSSNPFEGACQVQISENIQELKLKEYNEKCARVEAINEDVNDLHHIFGQLNEMVQVQGDSVQDVSESVESTANNVNAGVKHLQVAHRLKTTAYPMTGAVLGSMIGGPIGFVAGAKVGSLAALCLALIGYTGGKVFKNANEEFISQVTVQDNEAQAVIVDGEEKKNI